MPWKCEVCTLVNADDDKVLCSLCGKMKGTPDPDAGDERLKHMSLRAILKAGPEMFNKEARETQRLSQLKEVKGVFGVPLKTETPIVVCDCIAYLRAKGLYTEGLFRIPGNQDMVDALKNKYGNHKDKDTDVLNSLPCEIHDVGTLLKSFFRWLPEPIVPEKNYEGLLDACRTPHNSKQELENAVFTALKQIRSPNRECLSLLIQFLREVSTFEQINKMTAVNLATCFAPSLLRAPDSVSPEQALMDMSAAIGVLVVLIRSDRRLFLPSKDAVKSSTKHKPKGVMPPPPGLGGEKEKRRSSKKSFSLTKTFSMGRRSSKKEKERKSSMKAPPGLGPPVPPKREDKPPPPPVPQRRDHANDGSARSSKKAVHRAKSKKQSSGINIDEKI